MRHAHAAIRSAVGVLLLASCSSDGAVRSATDTGATFLFDAGNSTARDSSTAPHFPADTGAAVDAGAARLDAGTFPADAARPPGDGGGCDLLDPSVPVVLYLSADDSNSMASPAIARAMLRAGHVPIDSILRTYEFLNYYDVPYPFPALDHTNVVGEMRWNDEAVGELALQIGVQAAPRDVEPARVITFVLDRSGSMQFGSGPPIAREREVIRALAHVLVAGDLVSWVEWDTVRTVRLEGYAVAGADDPTLLSLADALVADGGTDLDAGLAFGYELAQRFYDPTRLNRVVLVSDGVANAGDTSIATIAAHAEDAEQDGIYLVGVGVGDGYNDTLMNAVTDAGRGAYVYVDSMTEAHVLFEDRFAETMDVGLLNVQLEVTLPWYMAVHEFHGEEYSVGDPTAVRPQNLSPGDAMVFHQTIRACDPAQIDLADAVRLRATYTRPNRRVMADDVVDTTLGAMMGGDHAALIRGDAIVAYAEALAAIARAREGHPVSPTDRAIRIDQADARITEALADPANADLAEIADLFAVARSM